jgi:UDP-N-acetyl-D-glucosamine dehydrogenase
VLRPILERSGLRAGVDFALAYSPERVDPGDPTHTASTTPKVVGAETAAERAMASAVYATFTSVVPVSDCRTAEAVKLSENIFRLVNIALANELKHAFAGLGVDAWEVIEAASTKPFGYMAFHPGPGVGGHCIPVDPFYLTWKAREGGEALRLVELAGDIAHDQPVKVVDGVARALNDRFGRALKGASILVLGVAYKRDIGDTRESPAGPVMEELERRGAVVSYHDPHVPRFQLREGATLKSSALEDELLSAVDCVAIVTDHAGVDYARVVSRARLTLDTRNATRRLHPHPNIVKL